MRKARATHIQDSILTAWWRNVKPVRAHQSIHSQCQGIFETESTPGGSRFNLWMCIDAWMPAPSSRKSACRLLLLLWADTWLYREVAAMELLLLLLLLRILLQATTHSHTWRLARGWVAQRFWHRTVQEHGSSVQQRVTSPKPCCALQFQVVCQRALVYSSNT